MSSRAPSYHPEQRRGASDIAPCAALCRNDGAARTDARVYFQALSSRDVIGYIQMTEWRFRLIRGGLTKISIRSLDVSAAHGEYLSPLNEGKLA